MRKILWLVSALILIISSCATSAPETADVKTEKKMDNPVKVEKVETIIVDVYLVSSETLSASDGIIDGYIEYNYDEMGTLLEKKEYDTDKILLNTMVNEVSGNKIVRTQWFSGEEMTPGMYIMREYSGMDLVKETSYDNKDVAQSISSYVYDNNGLVNKWTVSSGDNAPMMVTEYENSNGLRNKASFMTPLGESEGYIVYTWVDGKIETEKTYSEDDKLEKAIEYEYNMGNLVKENHYKKTVIDHTIEFDLDENGNAMTKKYFYRSGNLKSQWLYEYISVKKEVQQ